jgi:hypothetical protein
VHTQCVRAGLSIEPCRGEVVRKAVVDEIAAAESLLRTADGEPPVVGAATSGS